MTNKEYRDSYVSAHISNTVASQILMLRERHNWTQKYLAKKAGMSQSRISALEDPNYENIEVGTLKRIASAFEVALTVRFIPFSELVAWTTQLSTEKIDVADFESDSFDAALTAKVHAPQSMTILRFTNAVFGSNNPYNVGANQAQVGSLSTATTTILPGRYQSMRPEQISSGTPGSVVVRTNSPKETEAV